MPTPRADAVSDAIDAWERQGTIDPETANKLRATAPAQAKARSKGFASLLMQAAGSIVLVAAFVTLTTIFWNDLTREARAVFIWAVSLALMTFGYMRDNANPERPLGAWLMVAGAGLSLFAVMLVSWAVQPDRGFSRSQEFVPGWQSPFVWGAALLSAACIVVPAWITARRRAFVGPAALVMLVVFVPVSFSAFNLDYGTNEDAMVLLMDAIVVAALSVFVTWIVRRPEDSAPVPRHLREAMVVVGVAALVFLVPWTWYEVFAEYGRTYDEWGHIIGWALLAAASLAFGLRYERSGVIVVGSLVLIADAWFFGIEKGERFGTFLALLFTAVVLLWLGNRLGLSLPWQDEQADEQADEDKNGDKHEEGGGLLEGREPR